MELLPESHDKEAVQKKEPSWEETAKKARRIIRHRFKLLARAAKNVLLFPLRVILFIWRVIF